MNLSLSKMDIENTVLGTVIEVDHAQHEADYEHNFHLSNPIVPTEARIYEIVNELMKPIKQELDNVKSQSNKFELIEKQYEEVLKENKHLKEKLVKLECFSRRSNLKFYGYREQKGESKVDCKRAILNILRGSGIQLHHKAIESAHRIGPYIPKVNRPIIVEFFHGEERELVYTRSEYIYRVTGIRIEEDFPEVIENKRKVLKPILNKAANIRENGKRKYYSSLRLDKLNINGRIYTTDTMNKLPADIHPTKVYTPSANEITAFFGQQSPLSNHHLAKQTVDNINFNCNEQFYMYNKAKTFNDHITAAKILKECKPGAQKTLGKDKNISGFSKPVWRERCLDIMNRGLEAKFEQNPSLKEFLVNTGSSMLLEANPKDPYWGVGMSLYNKQIWVKNSWAGRASNHLGRLPSELRTVYKRNKL